MNKCDATLPSALNISPILAVPAPIATARQVLRGRGSRARAGRFRCFRERRPRRQRRARRFPGRCSGSNNPCAGVEPRLAESNDDLLSGRTPILLEVDCRPGAVVAEPARCHAEHLRGHVHVVPAHDGAVELAIRAGSLEDGHRIARIATRASRLVSFSPHGIQTTGDGAGTPPPRTLILAVSAARRRTVRECVVGNAHGLVVGRLIAHARFRRLPPLVGRQPLGRPELVHLVDARLEVLLVGVPGRPARRGSPGRRPSRGRASVRRAPGRAPSRRGSSRGAAAGGSPACGRARRRRILGRRPARRGIFVRGR
jgi:hypothetical protein